MSYRRRASQLGKVADTITPKYASKVCPHLERLGNRTLSAVAVKKSTELLSPLWVRKRPLDVTSNQLAPPPLGDNGFCLVLAENNIFSSIRGLHADNREAHWCGTLWARLVEYLCKPRSKEGPHVGNKSLMEPGREG